MDYIRPNYVYSRVLDNLPWKSGDPNVKGDPRKSVKWIDVSFFAKRRILDETSWF